MDAHGRVTLGILIAEECAQAISPDTIIHHLKRGCLEEEV